MPIKDVNWRLAAVLVIATVLLVVGVYQLWQWQSERVVSYELSLGMQAYEQHEWDLAAYHLGRYLDLVDNDIPVMLHYAESFLNLRPLKRSQVERAIATYREILRTDGTNEEALERLVGTYLELDMPSEVEFVLRRYADIEESEKFKKMLAVALIKQRKNRGATKILEEILRENPEAIEAYELLAKMAEGSRESLTREQAVSWLDKAVDNNSESAAAYIARGHFYLRNHNTTRALADFSVAERCDLSDPQIRLHLERGYIKMSEFDKALNHLRIIQKALPHSPVLWQSMAELALMSGSRELMFEVAEQGTRELSYQPWDFKSTAAQLYIEAGRSDLATELVSELRLHDIEPAKVEYLRGLLAYEQSNRYKAIKCWSRSIELGDDEVRNRQRIITALVELGDDQSAMMQLYFLVRKNPDLVKARLNLARLLIQSGHLDEAAEQAQLAKLAAPEEPDAEILHMHILIQQFACRQLKTKHQGWQNLQAKLGEIEKRWPDNLGVQELNVRLAMLQSQWQRAQQLLKQMAKRYPGRMEINLANAQLLIVLGRTDEAAESLNKTIQGHPDSVKPVKLLAAILAQNGNLQGCENLLESALGKVRSVRSRRELVLLMSGMYAHSGRTTEREKLIRSYLESSGDDVRLLRELVEIKIASGQSREAEQLIERIKTIEADDGWQWRYEQARLWFASEQFDNRYQPIVSMLKKNLKTNADDQYSRILLAQTYERAGRTKLAVLTCKDVLSRSVTNFEVSAPAVTILYNAGEYDYADRIITQMANQRAWSPELKAIEFRSLLQKGEFDLAVELLGDILAFCDSSGEPSFDGGSQRVDERLKGGGVCEALLLSNEIVERFRNANAYMVRSSTYAKLGRMDKAMEDFKQAALLEPDNVEIWLAKTRFDCSTGQMEEAVVDAKRTVDVANGDAEVCKEMLPILINAPDEQIRTEAKAVLDKLVAIYSDDLELQLCMVEYLVAERTNTSIDEAEEILQRVLSIENAPARARVLLAEIFMIRGDNSRAMEIVLSGLERDEKNKSLLQLKAGIEAKTSAKLAIPTRELLCELYPNDVFTAISLAECYLQTDQLLKAVDLLEKQREIFKAGRGRRQIDIKMATAFYRQGKTGLASELFASLCDGTDADIEIIMARVKLLIREQNWSGVRRITTGQMQKGERHISLVADIAQELVETGNRQAKLTAKSLLEQILEVYPDSVDAMRALAEQSYISSRFSEAVRLYGRILEMAPNDMKAINNLCWIMCEQDKQYSSALELANRGLASNSDCAELLDTRGMIYYQLGEYTKAAEDFDKSLNLCKAGSRAALFSHVHLGKVLVRLGRTQAAVENFNHALQLHDYVGGLSGNDIMEIRNLLQDISGGV